MQPGDVKAANADGQVGGEKRAREIDRPRELIRLDADQRDQRASAALVDIADNPVRPHAPIGFIKRVQPDFDARLPESWRVWASSASPLRQASVLDGNADLNHWMGYPSSS